MTLPEDLEKWIRNVIVPNYYHICSYYPHNTAIYLTLLLMKYNSTTAKAYMSLSGEKERISNALVVYASEVKESGMHKDVKSFMSGRHYAVTAEYAVLIHLILNEETSSGERSMNC